MDKNRLTQLLLAIIIILLAFQAFVTIAQLSSAAIKTANTQPSHQEYLKDFLDRNTNRS